MTTAKVSLRGTELAAEAELSQRDGDTAFIALEHPPPVGALLEVAAEGQVRGLRVASIDERGLTGSGAGCVGHWIDASQLAEGQARVGSEGLTPTIGEANASRPAPVVVTDEPSGVIDVGGEGAGEASGDVAIDHAPVEEEGKEAAEDSPGDAATGPAGTVEPDEAGSDEGGSGETGGDEGGKRPKKRKGRKRG